MHFPPKSFRNHCFQFLLGITVVLREIEDKGYAKFWGVNKMHYGLCENGEWGLVWCEELYRSRRTLSAEVYNTVSAREQHTKFFTS